MLFACGHALRVRSRDRAPGHRVARRNFRGRDRRFPLRLRQERARPLLKLRRAAGARRRRQSGDRSDRGPGLQGRRLARHHLGRHHARASHRPRLDDADPRLGRAHARGVLAAGLAGPEDDPGGRRRDHDHAADRRSEPAAAVAAVHRHHGRGAACRAAGDALAVAGIPGRRGHPGASTRRDTSAARPGRRRAAFRRRCARGARRRRDHRGRDRGGGGREPTRGRDPIRWRCVRSPSRA